MITRIARPYARALFDVLPDEAAATAALEDLRAFAGAMEEVPRLGAMAANPAIPMEVKQRTLGEIVGRMELGKPSRRLLALLLENYRLGHLPAVVEAFEEMVHERRGIARARVESAIDLDGPQRERLRATLERKLGREVRLDVETNPDLLGGFVARVGSLKYDGSVSGQLERLTEEMTAAAQAAGR